MNNKKKDVTEDEILSFMLRNEHWISERKVKMQIVKQMVDHIKECKFDNSEEIDVKATIKIIEFIIERTCINVLENNNVTPLE